MPRERVRAVHVRPGLVRLHRHLLIARAGCFTRDRPALLERCIASLCGALGDRELELTVYDDTTGGARWSPRARPAGVRFRYAGRGERIRYVDRLHAMLEGRVERATLEFGLLGDPAIPRTFGANRNGFLLDDVGACALSVDDDEVARFALPPGAGGDGPLTVATGPDVTEWWFFRDRAELEAAARWEAVDLLSRLDELFAGTGARVAVLGVAGDCGLGSSAGMICVSGASRARLLSNPDLYRELRTTREIIRVAPTTTLTKAPALMAGFAAFDHRTLLPPFFPVLRTQDALFARVLRRADEAALVAHLPWAALHAPEPRRFDDEARHRAFADASTLHVLEALVQMVAPAPGPPEAWLRRFGEEIGRLAAQPAAQRAAFLDALFRERWRQRVAHLEALRAEHGRAPAYWDEDMRAAIEAVRARLDRPGLVVPDDLPPDPDPSALAWRLLGSYGDLLRAWPAIVDASRALAQAGERVGAAA